MSQKIYDAPNNIFVAGFLGSPSMNFLDATLQTVDHQLVIKAAGLTLPIPAAFASRYKPLQDQNLSMGIMQSTHLYQRERRLGTLDYVWLMITRLCNK